MTGRRILWKTVFPLLLLLAQFQVRGAIPFHFNLFANYDRQWFVLNSATLWNPHNLFGIAEGASRLFFNPEARLSLTAVRAKLSPYLTIDQDGQAETGLREVSATLSLGKVELTAGKVLLKLGTGYMFTPLSVITPAKAVSDPEDSLRSQQGVTMVKADYYRENWSLSALVFKKNNWHNFALFGNTSWKGVDVYGLLYYPEYKKLEGGLALATTVSQGLELHGEIMLHRRSPLLFHQVYQAIDPRVSYDEWPLYQPPDRLYSELLLGGNLTVKGINLIAEYYHRDWGLKKKWWQNLKEHFLFNLQPGGDPFSSLDIGADMQIVGNGRNGLMRDYVFARIAKNIGQTDISAVAFVNLADFSLMSVVELNYGLADGLAVFIRPLFFSGGKASEFGNSFYSSMIQIGFTAVL